MIYIYNTLHLKMNILPYDVICNIPKYLNYFWLYKNRGVLKYWYNLFEQCIPLWRKL